VEYEGAIALARKLKIVGAGFEPKFLVLAVNLSAKPARTKVKSPNAELCYLVLN
jgi:hypothetical protein